MACSQCGKEIEPGKGIAAQGNLFCNNLCRYSYEKVHGKPVVSGIGFKRESGQTVSEKTSKASNVQSQKSNLPGKAHVAWKIYFWVLLLLSIPTYIAQGFHRFWEIFDVLYFIGSMIGFTAFCWPKKLGAQYFWRIFFWTSLVWNILYLFIFPILPHYAPYRHGQFGFFFCLVNFIFFIPLETGLFLYSYKRKSIWE